MRCVCCARSCSWQVVGSAADMACKLQLPRWQPRSLLTISQLSLALAKQDFDVTGVLLWAGEVTQGALACRAVQTQMVLLSCMRQCMWAAPHSVSADPHAAACFML